MSLHRRSELNGISIPQIALGIVAIAAVAIAVLINRPATPAPDDARRTGTASTSIAGPDGSPPTSSAIQTASPAGPESAQVSPSPTAAQKDAASGAETAGSAGSSPAGVSGADTPAAQRPPARRRTPPSPQHTGLRLPDVTFPSCVVDC